MVAIKKQSYLGFSDLLQIEDAVYFDAPLFPDLLPDDTDQIVEVDARLVGRLDLIAYEQLGDAELWWIIALMNDLDDLPTDVRIGRKLRIPSKTRVSDYLTKAKKT